MPWAPDIEWTRYRWARRTKDARDNSTDRVFQKRDFLAVVLQAYFKLNYSAKMPSLALDKVEDSEGPVPDKPTNSEPEALYRNAEYYFAFM